MKLRNQEKFLRLSGSLKDGGESLGPLADLVGTWSGNRGWNLIAVPAPGSKPDDTGDFQLLVRPYFETITFNPLGASVRNRGGDEDQFINGLDYQIRITDLETNEPLHVENGMWLNLADISSNPGGDPEEKPEFQIARSATIPHGDSAMVLGNSFVVDKAPDISPINSLPPDTGPNTPLGYTDVYMNTKEEGLITALDLTQNLRADIEGQKILKTTTIHLDSSNQGGVTNIPFIVHRANASRFISTFWIETVEDPDSGQTFQQLQYSQVIDLDFHKKFGAEGLITWPHVNVNTMRKQ